MNLVQQSALLLGKLADGLLERLHLKLQNPIFLLQELQLAWFYLFLLFLW